MNHGSLFSGIGGFDLAAQWMGWNNLFHCEWNEFGQKVLKYYWPNAKSYHDITKSTFAEFQGRIDILTGGFPCQPFSTAGKRQGTEDNRYLWPEMLRVIREIKPRYIVGENVRGLVNWNGGMVFEQVCSDLEVEGYEVLPILLPACAINAPHRRDRIWFVADSKINGMDRSGTIRKQKSQIQIKKNVFGCNTSGNYWKDWKIISQFCNEDDGFSNRLDGITFSKWRKESIKAGGNAIVPQVAFEIFKVIEQLNQKP